MEQEHRISYQAGITRTPSDFLCADGELAECINLTSDSEELKPVVQPAEFVNDWATGASGRAEIVYVHKVANRDNYIGYFPSDSNKLCCGAVSNKIFSVNTTFTSFYWQPGTSQISSVGKTLIISDSDGLHYFLWKNNRYKQLGQIPQQNITFALINTPNTRTDSVTNSAQCDGIFSDATNPDHVNYDKHEEFNDLVIGLYSKNKKSIAQKKRFCKPFFVRTALRLYDDSYIHISQPVLMLPSMTANTVVRKIQDNVMQMITWCRALTYNNESYYPYDQGGGSYFEDWTDIVKDIVVFVTDGIDIYDLSVDQNFGIHFNLPEANHEDIDGVYVGGEATNLGMTYGSKSEIGFGVLKKRDSRDVEADITASSVFYKVCTIGLFEENRPIGDWSLIDDKIETHYLENLTTQEFLQNDDYFSYCSFVADTIYAYNSRLNLANVKRSMFEGFDYFFPFAGYGTGGAIGSGYDGYCRFYVTIQTDDGEKIVMHESWTPYYQGVWFYYPDSRAKHVDIFRKVNGSNTWHRLLTADLKEHEGLNGAYYFKGLPNVAQDNHESYNTSATPPTVNATPELLGNYIVTSEVNNPWVYKAEGYNKVGTGKIIGISETTMALSQDAYGRNDLVVFSESGTWGMSVDRTGLFQSIHPFTRDVCINKNSITKADFGVFFVSKKGLMLLTDQGVSCVSQRMNGKTFNTSSLSPLATDTDWASIVSTCQGNTSFLDYIRDSRCFLAYDYIDSRVLIINHAYGYQYIFNMKDATLSKTILPQVAHAKVESYPDNLLLGTSNVYSFYEKQREEEVSARQLAFLLTRPMKLAGPVSKASLRQLKNVGFWDKGTTQTPLSCVKTEIYLSDDMLTWYPDISRFGAAAKYYRLALYIKMLPTERLSGTILTEQPRRDNNQR